VPENNNKNKKKLTVEEQPTQLTKAAKAVEKNAVRSAPKPPAKAPAKTPAKVEPAITRKVVRLDREIPLRYVFAGFCAIQLLIFGCVFFSDGGVITQWLVNVFTGLFGRNVYLITMPALIYLIWIQLASRNQRVRMRSVCIMLFVFLFGCLSHLVAGKAMAQIGWELVKELYATGIAGSSGGVFCGTVTELMVRGFGRFCTGAVMLMGAVTCVLWAAKIRLRDVYHGIIKGIRKLKDNNGQYLWQPSLVANTPDTLLGRPIKTSAYMPTMATAAKAVAFGDFKYYWIADRQGRSFKRLNELYAANGQVGFLGSQRVDGKLILPEAIKVLQMKGGTAEPQ
jgi:hypothetical protein